MQKFRSYFNDNWTIGQLDSRRSVFFGLLIFAVVVVLFSAYNVINFTTPRQFNSPDEMVHYEFIKNFAQESSLTIEQSEGYGELGQYVFPRSTYAADNRIIPIGFWGLNVIYGIVAKVVGISWIVYLTSILLLAAGWCFYSLIRKVFDKKTALISVFLFYTHPVIWYYTARSLFPNIPFISLLLLGIYFLIIKPIKKWWGWNDALGIFFIGLSLLIRPSEIWWVGLGFLVVLIFYFKKFDWRRLFIWCLGAMIFAGLYFAISKTLFSDALVSYTASASFQFKAWYNIFFPFGIEVKDILKSGLDYFVRLFWWLTIPGALGLILLLKDWQKRSVSKQQKSYLLVLLVVGIFLFIFYGSFVDIRYSLKTIGISYTRYWLPIFILSLPLTAYGFIWLVNWLKTKIFRQVILAWLLLFILIMNISLVFCGVDGLLAARDNILHGAEVRAEVLNMTTAEAIIVTQTEDKFFWPERQVMQNVKNPDISQAIADLLDKDYPMYFFTSALNQQQLANLEAHYSEYGLNLEFIRSFGAHVLYKFTGLES